MSGTSLDGVDGVLANFAPTTPLVMAHASAAFPPALQAELLALNTPGGADELHRAALAANALMRLYAQVVTELLATARCRPDQVRAIGAHGQTVRHQPRPAAGDGYTLQLANPALLAELTAIDVVADFRSRDVAAAGQGAPLAPFFHRAVFGAPGQCVAVLNVGGIANLTLLAPDGGILGFDCGPGNSLMDAWCRRHWHRAFDDGGALAASGAVLPQLLAALEDEPYFRAAAPKSTGRDLFNDAWLDARLAGHAGAAPQDVLATLAELTARACAGDLRRLDAAPRQLVVCGGGALNGHLMRRLSALLAPLPVLSSAQLGLPPLQVEASAFAWLARAHVERAPIDTPPVTGARGPRVLGALYPR